MSLSFRNLSFKSLSLRSLSFGVCLSEVCLSEVCLSEVCLSEVYHVSNSININPANLKPDLSLVLFFIIKQVYRLITSQGFISKFSQKFCNNINIMLINL